MADEIKMEATEKETQNTRKEANKGTRKEANKNAARKRVAKKSKAAETNLADVNNLKYEDVEYIMEKRRTKILSEQERQNVYRDEASVTYMGEEEADGEIDDLLKEMQLVIAAAKSETPHIVTIVVTGYLLTENAKMPIIVGRLKDCKGYVSIKIPLDYFCFYNHRLYEGPDRYTLLNSLMKAYIGAEVKTCIFNVQEKERVAYGNRLQALDILGHFNYRKEQVREGRPNVVKGCAATATVIATMKDRLIADVCGADVEIKSRELSWIMPGPINQEFSVGDKIKVKIMDVGPEQEIHIGDRIFRRQPVVASKKALMRNPADLFFDQFQVGQLVSARITSPNTESGVYVTLQGQMSALCGAIPVIAPVGSTCMVIIEDKYEDSKMIRGRIILDTIRPPKPTL